LIQRPHVGRVLDLLNGELGARSGTVRDGRPCHDTVVLAIERRRIEPGLHPTGRGRVGNGHVCGADGDRSGDTTEPEHVPGGDGDGAPIRVDPVAARDGRLDRGADWCCSGHRVSFVNDTGQYRRWRPARSSTDDHQRTRSNVTAGS
jgi:hypothetical protein